jgi:hypothetical protein
MRKVRFHDYTHRGRAALLLMSTERLAVSASSFTVLRWYLHAESAQYKCDGLVGFACRPHFAALLCRTPAIGHG